MSNETAGSLGEQLTQSASTENTVPQQTQGADQKQQSRREDGNVAQGGNQPRTNTKLSVDGSSQLRERSASGRNEEFSLSSLESSASLPVADGKRPLEAPFPIGDATRPQDSGAVSTSFKHATPADKTDDLAELPKGASSLYREKYAEVMREFRDGKLQIVVKDRGVAIAIAAEQATRIEAGPQQKQASGTEQKQASNANEKQASSNDQKQGR